MPLFLVGAETAPVWITPKFSIPLAEKMHFGIGVLGATVLAEGFGFGIAYASLTYGTTDNNTTFGGGWAYADGEFAKYPTFNFSGMYRLGKKGYFLTENYLISTGYETFGIIALGGRSVQKKLAVDYGLVLPINTGIGTFIAVPWLSITIPFGNI